MFENIEEKIESYQLKSRTCSETSFKSAQKILDKYKEFSSTIKDDGELLKRYNNVDANEEDAIEKIALLVTTACFRLQGKKWHIPGKEILWDIIPRLPQIAGGIELCKLDSKNLFARQRTGEGKTVTLLFVIAYLAKKGSVHVITANDYLARRDQMWVGPILNMLGISNSWLSDDIKTKSKTYSAKVIYGSDKEFTFDYLRDTIRKPGIKKLCKDRDYVVVDEADHILLDELSTPIVLSESAKDSNSDLKMANDIIVSIKEMQEKRVCDLLFSVEDAFKNSSVEEHVLKNVISLRYSGVCYDKIRTLQSKMYKEFAKSEKLEMILMQTQMLEEICNDLYFIVDLQRDTCYFTENGLKLIEESFLKKRVFTIPDYNLISNRIHKTKLEDLYKNRLLKDLSFKEDRQNSLIRAFLLSLQAHLLLHKDRDYLIKNGEVELITKSIGRSDTQKRFNQDLSLAVELKENVKVKSKSTVVSATLLPNFISLYKRFAALSGTIFPDQEEFTKIYNARLFNIPTFKKVIAHHKSGRIFETTEKKHKVIIRDVKFASKLKIPILVGTNSVEYSEELSQLFSKAKIHHKILNARNEYEEAEIVSKAGNAGSVVIATNIAGRGTDIKVSDSVNNIICNEYYLLIKEKLNKNRPVKLICHSSIEKNLILKCLKVNNINRWTIKQKGKNGSFQVLIGDNSRKRTIEFPVYFGLRVIVSETFMSRRIENQLRGRTGRQGAPGSSAMYFSLEDDNLHSISSMSSLIRKVLFGRVSFLGKIDSIHNYLISMVNRINEGNDREHRKERLFYDRITEEHRKKIEGYRNLLHEPSINNFMYKIIEEYIDELANKLKKGLDEKRLEEFCKKLKEDFNILPEFLKEEFSIDNDLLKKVKTFMWEHYLKIDYLNSKENKNYREVLCAIIDELWAQYLEGLSAVRDQAGRSMYLGKDDKVYYINIVTEYFMSVIFEMKKASVINVFHNELSHEKNASPTHRMAELEDEISELIL